VIGNPNIARVNLMAGFFPNMPTLEFAPSPSMSEENRHHAEQFLHSCGLQTQRIDDIVGFVVPRIVAMLVNEAAFAVMENVSSVKEIDDAMRLGTNYPKGPLRWADEIGIDVVVSLLDSLYAEYRQERYRACRLMRRYVDMQWLGERTGKGFYEYEHEDNDAIYHSQEI
jgi:3-hydroxybutyryl-CoA dehydrogenase